MKREQFRTRPLRPARYQAAEPQPARRGAPPEDWDWQQPVAAPPPRPAAARISWQALAAFLAVATIAAGLATLLIAELWLAERIMPGVYVWDVDLGGLTREEAIDRLSGAFRYPDDRIVVLRYGDKSWPVDPGELGAQLDVAATVDRAMNAGHTGDPLATLRDQAGVLLNGRLVVPVVTFDPGASSMFLSRVASQVNTPLRNASLTLGDDLSVQVIPGQAGREVDEEATRQALRQRIAALSGGEVPLVVRETPPLMTDVGAAEEQVRRIVSGPVTLTAPDAGPWTIEPRMLADWLILQPTAAADGQMILSVSLDEAQIATYAREMAGQVAREPQNAGFRFDEGAGTLVTTADSVPGRTLDVTATVSVVQQAATADQRSVELPLVSVRPALASADGPSLGIVELIGEGVTSFDGSSAARMQNIGVGAAQFDGLLIAPGEIFSFNRYLGEVTKEKGYEEGIIIWGNTTRADVGGGLCQVSSTAFRAAFWSGLPIVERYPHAFRVSYYEPPLGLDATIYSPDVDLKWENDTGHYILIQTYFDRDARTLTFRYFGTNPGRTVDMEGPEQSNPVRHGPPVYRDDPTLPKGQTKQIEFAKDGLDVTVYRIVKQDGVEVRRDTFFSRYQPWQAVFLVGTKQ